MGRFGDPMLVRTDICIETENRHPELNTAQRQAVDEVFLWREKIVGLDGVAGAGKTTALAVVREGAKSAGYKVEGFAPTSRAAQTLGDARIETKLCRRILPEASEREVIPERLVKWFSCDSHVPSDHDLERVSNFKQTGPWRSGRMGGANSSGCFTKTLISQGATMHNIGQYKPGSEPDREVVERAILKVLEIAEHQGITAADFIKMLDSGLQLSDFLNASDVLMAVPAIPSIDDDTVN